MDYNIKDFGALGDGVTDDTAAIQAAIDAAHAAGGGTIYLPAGEYQVSGGEKPSDGALLIKSNVYLVGAGMGETVIKLVDGSDQDITGMVRSAYSEETSNFGMRDLTLDGNRDNTTGNVDGWFNGCIPGKEGADRDVTLERVEIREMSGSGFDSNEQTINLTIRDSVAHDNGLDGFVADYQTGGVFENNASYNNDRHGFNVVTSTHDFTLTNNVAYGNGGAGVVVQRGLYDVPHPYNVLIDGGAYYDNGREGVLIRMSHDVTLQNADIYGNGTYGVRVYGAQNVDILDNQIHDNAQSGSYPEVLLQSYDDTAGVSGNYYTTTNTWIEGNVINGSANSTYGVQERNDGTDYSTLYNNSICGGQIAPVQLYGEHSTVSNQPTIIEGTDSNDVLEGAEAHELILGKDGDDHILLGDGCGDIVNGGEGFDVVQIEGSSSDFHFSTVNGRLVATNTQTPSESVAVSNVEIISFGAAGDDNVVIVQNVDQANAMRLYQGLFNRSADIGGAQFWLNVVAKGIPLVNIADCFLESEEYLSLPSQSDEEFIDRLYVNALGRQPEETGRAFWLGELANGASHAQVAASIVSSDKAAEAITNVLLREGLSTSGNDTIVASVGNDTIDAGEGFDVVQVQLAEGLSSDDYSFMVENGNLVATNNTDDSLSLTLTNTEILSFSEVDNVVVTSNNTDATAMRLYQGLFGRSADMGGAKFWLDAIDQDTSLSDIAHAFMASEEFEMKVGKSYQELSNEEYVELLYQNALSRTANEGEKAYWLEQLGNGASHQEVVLAIVGSPEAENAIDNVQVITDQV